MKNDRQQRAKELDALAQKVIGLISQLPPSYVELHGTVMRRTVWSEFATLAKQDEPLDDRFCAKVIRALISTLLEKQDYYTHGWLWHETPAYKKLRKKGRGSFAVKPDTRHNAVVDLIYDQVFKLARASKTKTPYRRSYLLEELKGYEDVLKVLVPKTAASGWDWLGLNRQPGGKIELVKQNPKEECRKTCQLLWGRIGSTSSRRKTTEGTSLPQLVESAIDLAVEPVDFQQVETFVETIVSGVLGESRSYEKLPLIQEVLAHGDPSIFLPFASKPILTNEEADPFVATMIEVLSRSCPNREFPIAQLLLAVVRRLVGDQDAVYPLLYGPPGTAKTYLVEQLSYAFCEAGIPTNFVLQAMTQSGGHSEKNNEVAMSLQGISSKWGNARHGMIFSSSFRSDVKLTLVALDEIDKCSLHDYLVSLLDPRQALQDSFWREVVPTIDMRKKVLFFSTANNVEIIRKGGSSPLWSRLKPIEMAGYSHDESIDLVASLVNQRFVLGDRVDEGEVRKTASSVVNRYRSQALPSIRALLDQVNQELYVNRLPSLSRLIAVPRNEYRPPKGIGFSVE